MERITIGGTDALKLEGYTYPELELGSDCPAGGGSCRGEVFVYRAVGSRAHGICNTHRLAVRFPAWRVPEFPGTAQDAGRYILVQIPGSEEAKLAKLSDAAFARLDVSSMPPGEKCFARVAYFDDGALCVAVEYPETGQQAVFYAQFLDFVLPHVRTALLDGFGIFCLLDLETTGKTYWPEYPIDVIEQITAA